MFSYPICFHIERMIYRDKRAACSYQYRDSSSITAIPTMLSLANRETARRVFSKGTRINLQSQRTNPALLNPPPTELSAAGVNNARNDGKDVNQLMPIILHFPNVLSTPTKKKSYLRLNMKLTWNSPDPALLR